MFYFILLLRRYGFQLGLKFVISYLVNVTQINNVSDLYGYLKGMPTDMCGRYVESDDGLTDPRAMIGRFESRWNR